MSGLEVVYLLVDHPEAKGKAARLGATAGRSVTVSGRVPESSRRAAEEPMRLEVRSFEPAPAE